ncbi:putative adenosine monophosphate-protein transferase Fic [Pseudomonas sp. B21-035]|uniref:putative adenosine monophosphate-protein transferase Fic n=1 Tax=Pseudomonas sp. B21-035 TaxID=2895484 RepID=UPI00215E51D1|nr:putative adenosine monophosphate-protein transferase Fic [Pseudomonas sp. B21-035]UVL59005.1 putative adenosine monophosphate-protein transferase Fic [Pseudomonas sp. B21-035]
MLDKYGVGQDPYCYAGTGVLRNLLDLQDDTLLSQAERDLSSIAASEIDFALPPYDLPYLQNIHRRLFQDLYAWAGELRTVDISKGDTHFCTVNRIEPESVKLFKRLAQENWLENLTRGDLVTACAEHFGDLNMLHPFREGNGRAQRILFEHLILNAGYTVSWWAVNEQEWLRANIEAVVCDYRLMALVFDKCIGQTIIE